MHKMRLLTNNPTKRVGLESYGLEIVENVPIEVIPNKYNESLFTYLKEEGKREVDQITWEKVGARIKNLYERVLAGDI